MTGNNSRIDNGVITFNDSSSYTTANTVAFGRYGGAGTISVNDLATITSTGGYKLGRIGDGTINQSGGVVSTTSTLDLGNTNGGTGLYNLSGGTVSAAGITFFTAGDDFNFTLGSTGILTILNGGADCTSGFGGFVTNGDITLGGSDSESRHPPRPGSAFHQCLHRVDLGTGETCEKRAVLRSDVGEETEGRQFGGWE